MDRQAGQAFGYHEKVSYDRREMGGHFLDWANQPRVEKVYPGRRTFELSREVGFPDLSLGRILDKGPPPKEAPPLTPERLSRMLFSAYGVSARARQPGGELHLRTAPSAGALYPCELYLDLAQDRDGSAGYEPGLYHYRPQTHGLTRLGSGRQDLEGTVFFITVIPFRSAWKYRARAFRYCCLDTGHLVENLFLALRAEGYEPVLELELEEGEVNSFLGVDPERESCLAAVGLGARPISGGPALTREPALALESRVSESETVYQPLKEVMAASRAWAEPAVEEGDPAGLGLETGETRTLARAEDCPEKMSFGQAAAGRRSRRNFIKTEPDPSCLGYLVRMMGAEGPAAFRVGLLAGEGSGLEEGFHLLDQETQAPALVRSGDIRSRMASVCLDQAWLGQAAFHFLFLADLERLERERGPGGYREAMVLAGRLGQRLYLGATALGWGCCGVGAFYDGEARELLGLGETSRMLYLVGVGPVKG